VISELDRKQYPMSDLEKAKHLFRSAGLPFPVIPEELGQKLKERDKWVFSTHVINVSPYSMDHYIDEVNKTVPHPQRSLQNRP